MDRFAELEIFTRIAEEANLTRAAEELGAADVGDHLIALRYKGVDVVGGVGGAESEQVRR